ncbi:coiled-coil domain-containing protein 9 isoform X3 [Xyrichtys novacula]|uniref:Coiled-coil domain-containing protein 9 isoform X3 n=1 Tax=Xyrichtys novacula TaxID=13765 RepID=A0AAV1FVX2_XYRNO|nr:coiled-coil domain-containing protein 9 isoform X3 [Xyrichtys novacula]
MALIQINQQTTDTSAVESAQRHSTMTAACLYQQETPASPRSVRDWSLRGSRVVPREEAALRLHSSTLSSIFEPVRTTLIQIQSVSVTMTTVTGCPTFSVTEPTGRIRVVLQYRLPQTGETSRQPPVDEDRTTESAMSSAVDLKTKEEKDAELDRRIEALRKKNEALVKRYQEIEEDKKKAEQEGIAVTTPRKPRPHEPETDRRRTEKENFTVTVDMTKVSGEKRVVNDWKPSTPRGRKSSEGSEGHGGGQSDNHRGQSDGHSSPPRRTGSGRVGRGGQRGGRQERREWEPRTPRDGEPGEPGGQGRRGGRRGRGGDRGGGGGDRGGGGAGGGDRGAGEGGTPGGMDKKSKEWEEKRRQNIEKMNEEMERIAEYERGQRPDGDKPIRNFLDDPRRSGPVPDMDRKEGSRRHVRNWGGLDFDNVKTGAELEKEWTSRRPGPKGSVDMTMSMTGRERAEYLRWKKEREQIDEERLARHRNATGQWRREWDAQKTDNMFKEDPCAAAEGFTPEHGGRREDSKRPPKAPTFGDFLSQGRNQGPRGDRGRGRSRGQKPSYSMHDNRWEGEKEEEVKEKEDKTKKTEEEEKVKEKEKEEEKPKPAPALKVEETVEDAEEDEEEWEDASDGEDDHEEEEEESDSEPDSRGDEKKDKGKEKPAKAKGSNPPSPAHRPGPPSAGGAKEQRTPRPKVHIPAPTAVQESPEGGKPLSPFSPLDSHQPVSDWGEEMEMLSPRSSMGGESPLKPPSVESSPPQKKDQEEKEEEEEEEKEKSQAPSSSEQTEPQRDGGTEAQQTVTVSEPESIPADSSPSDSAPSEVTEAAVTEDQDPAASPSEEADLSSSEHAGEKDGVTAPDETRDAPSAGEVESSEQTSSG